MSRTLVTDLQVDRLALEYAGDRIADALHAVADAIRAVTEDTTTTRQR